ncbi:MAG: NAD(P)/FAD-dependent oxidoreductase [Deltaproteobacteria bacterium]|nr:NAD(P)/FAD-dependent oxidoreductase [Deltaproteobacteria bacterium]
MSIHHPIRAMDEGDDAIRTALQDAHLPSLMVALAHATGDESLLRDDLRPNAAFTAGPQGGFSEEQIETARALCLDVLRRYRDAGCPAPAVPEEAQLRRWLSFLAGDVDLDAYLPLLLAELALDGADVRAPDWSKQELAPESDFRVAIIGAGMSGLAAALRLEQADIPFVILEKNDDLGGTWYENTYPGCRVDVPNHFYSYSFAQKDDWPQLFSSQDVLLDYFRDCADEFGLREHIRFNTEVSEAVWDEGRATWTLALRHADGSQESLDAQAIISAVGQLNRPLMPEIEGIEDYRGASFHSACWEADVDLAQKRVGVIGTGASAAQFIPVIAEEAAELHVFQRTAPWLLPTPDYHDEVPRGLQWLFARLPFYAQWYRFWLFWTTSDGLLAMVRVEDDWPHPERSVSPANDMLREMLTEYIRDQCEDDEVLFEKMRPDYPPCSKRFVRDNGLWTGTFKRENVELHTQGIERITEKGILDREGREIALDAIVYGTGFTASDFLTPMKVVGRGGRNLHTHWDGDARAYLGITVPHFPNFFVLYGPNTNIVVNGSIIFFSECEVNYVLGCLELLFRGGHRALDCRESVHDAYNRSIDEANMKMAWGAASVNTWYKNATGRVSQNWPSTLLEYWQRTREPDPNDYELL